MKKRGQVKYGTNYLSDTNIVGFTHEMPEVLSRELAEGRYFTQLDDERGAPVCDVGFDIADKLLPGSIRRQEIHVDTAKCEVIGVGEKARIRDGTSQDNWVIMPITTYQKIYSQRRFGAICG